MNKAALATALALGALEVSIGDRVVLRRPASTRGAVKGSGKANPAKKAQRKRQRKARRAQR